MNKINIVDRFFPVKFDFYEMLSNQAELNALGVNSLYNWLQNSSELTSDQVIKYADQADEVRMKMEKDLIQAFYTPFSRADIYSISVGMDKVLEYAKSTLLSMEDFEVAPNEIIICMVAKLNDSTEVFARCLKSLKNHPTKLEKEFVLMRSAHTCVEKLYRDGMIEVFKSGDFIYALKQREVYHHIKDASTYLEDAVDVLHRIVVRLT
ncbi:MAG: DUF47 family protein [Clostridia bacterium]